MGATPSPPPTSTTVPSSLRMWLGKPSGPMKSRMVSPSRKANISNVVLPTAWMTTVTVPLATLKSATVSGMRSPCSSMQIEDGIPLAQGQHFERGFPHRLDDYGDRAVGHIEIGHGQRDAFPMLVDASHHKVSGTCCSRHIRRFHVPEEGRRTELYSTADEKHHTPWKAYGSKIQGKGSFDAFTICPADPRSLA